MLDFHCFFLNNWKKVTRDITNNYVSTFVIFKMVCYLKQRSKIYQTFYVSFFTFLVCYLLIIWFIDEGWITNIIWWIIMYFRNIKIHWYEWVGGGRNILSCHWEIIDSIISNLWRILHTIMLALFSIFALFCP